MFENAELGRKISKQEMVEREPQLRMELLRIQSELKDADFPVIILINGVDGAGKGDTANILHEWMDARYLRTYAVAAKTEDESQRPDYWRYWMAIPPRGNIAVFFGSWYTEPIINRVVGGSKKKADPRALDAELDAALIRVNTFEKELVEDGALIIKFWLHLSKKKQKRRLKKLEKNKETRYRVNKRDWKHHRMYDDFVRVCERTLRQTSTGEAPWQVVEGANANYRNVTVAETILERVDARLAERRAQAEISAATKKPVTVSADHIRQPTLLDALDLSQALEKPEYEEQLAHWQRKLNILSRKARKKGVGAIALFEGWDAGGKGSAIRRITKALDARYYNIIPIAAPTDEELAHHYLWRFWRHLPRLGMLTIYDRSWYGRVLVERVEGFADDHEWRRAYHEINDFEEQLCNHGIALVKYWLHISKDEQLARFEERQQKAWKRYKITDEDWRNREKWDAYEQAADEMIGRTSTEYAPWTLIEGNNKRFARIKVLQTLCESLSARIKAT
jgi:polyphosphate:AMP phosphotransferase